MKRVSIITPFFNEERSLPLLRERIEAVLGRLEFDYEVVLVDDHSADGSPAAAKQWAASDPRVQYLRLSRNCGSHAAFSAGLAHCTGDCAILMASDLQDPPEFVPDLLDRWQAGHDVVWAVRAQREGETRSTRLFSTMYYRMMRRLALPDMPEQGADFLLLDRKVIEAYRQNAEKNTSILALIGWLGFRQTHVEYVKKARGQGRSKWTFSKKVKLVVDSVVSFSYVPIRAMSAAGLLMALGGVVYAAVVLVGRLAGWVEAGTEFAALMTVLLVGQGMIIAMLGVLGEYLWRTFDEARKRQPYIVEERFRSADRPDAPTTPQVAAHPPPNGAAPS